MKASRGFTLMEVLVALGVLAVSMAAVTSAIGAGASNAGYLRDRTFAQWIAMNKVTELQISREWASPGETKGTYEMANREWRWEVKVSETDEEAVHRVDVKVFGEERATEPLAVLVAYADRPL